MMMKKVVKLNRNTESGSSPAHLQVPPLFRFPRCHFPLSCHSDRSPGIQSFDCHFQELSLSFAISPFSRLTPSRCPSGARCSLVPIWPQPYSHQPTSNRCAYRIYFHTYLIKQILMYPPIYLLSTHTHLPQTGAFDTANTLIPVVDSSTYSFRSSTPCCCFMLSFGTPKMKDLACSSWWILCPLRPKNLSVSD